MRTVNSLVIASAVAGIITTATAHADVTISKKPTVNMTCSGGVCSPTASNAMLNATDLTNMLASGDVKVVTGSGATNIVVKDSVGWASTSRLTLDANQSVTIDKPVMVTGTGAVTVTTNDGGSGGDLIFDGKGNVTFWDLTSSLIVNGNSYTLVGDIATLASDIANNPSGFYALANDYDASVDGTYTASPISTELFGVFEGLGHAISNLSISSADIGVALFEVAQGTIRDVGLVKVSISGSSDYVGSLLAASDSATIVGCYANGTIVLGGSANVVGGLVAISNNDPDGIITRSHASVSINAPTASSAGGLVGLSLFVITDSYATGNLKAGSGVSAGGLIGSSYGDISESYATGKVIAGENANVGGLSGLASKGIGIGTIENSYATGSVKAGTSSFIGGLAGNLGNATVSSTYSMGAVRGESSGGFLGTESDAQPSFDYWDTDTSGKGRRQGCGGGRCTRAIKGLTTEQFQSGLPDGFDPSVWAEKPNFNGGLPYLLTNSPK